jgi:hypothetical protein
MMPRYEVTIQNADEHVLDSVWNNPIQAGARHLEIVDNFRLAGFYIASFKPEDTWPEFIVTATFGGKMAIIKIVRKEDDDTA